jgi:hypothetical protein
MNNIITENKIQITPNGSMRIIILPSPRETWRGSGREKSSIGRIVPSRDRSDSVSENKMGHRDRLGVEV